MNSRTEDVLAVVSQLGRAVSFHDLTTYALLANVEVKAEPHELSFDARRRLLYVSHTYDSGWYFHNGGRGHEVSVLDVDTREVVGTIDLGPAHGPHGLWLDAEADLLYVSVEADDSAPGALLVVDPESRTVLDRIDVGVHGPHWFAVTPDRTRVYTANKEAPFLSVVDVATRRMTGRIEVPGSEGIAVSLDGARVFVAGPAYTPDNLAGETGLRVIDTATDTVVRTIRTEHRLSAVHVTAAGLVLTTEMRIPEGGGHADATDGELRVYSADAGELIGMAPIGKAPLTLTSSPDGWVGYVANSGSATVTVVDLRSCRTLHTIEAGPGAHGLAYLPASGSSAQPE
ncbi:YncE family protein [Amycolatopsis sp. H20-H5]|uniref:YncE family protein n=1 Tax=Amycolatopsis sp. H20-H5 TaxID=3046309 RepID=UPI002DB5FB52|nr:YncE family protein [Amycolatopsis sp. H20-H5]MEC3977145.1 YncE family protein [Amycolatopsis sp. H20-H5]